MLDEIGAMEFEALAKVFKEALTKKDRVIENGKHLRMTVAQLPAGHAVMEFGGDISCRVIMLRIEHDELRADLKARGEELDTAEKQVVKLIVDRDDALKKVVELKADAKRILESYESCVDKRGNLRTTLNKIRLSTSDLTCICCKANHKRASEALE